MWSASAYLHGQLHRTQHRRHVPGHTSGQRIAPAAEERPVRPRSRSWSTARSGPAHLEKLRVQRGRPSPHGALRREQRRRGGGGLQQAQSAGPQIIGHSSAPLGITRQAVQPITTKNQRVKNQAQKKDEKTNGKNPEYWAKRGFLVGSFFTLDGVLLKISGERWRKKLRTVSFMKSKFWEQTQP